MGKLINKFYSERRGRMANGRRGFCWSSRCTIASHPSIYHQIHKGETKEIKIMNLVLFSYEIIGRTLT
jgi:hypothetical protein